MRRQLSTLDNKKINSVLTSKSTVVMLTIDNTNLSFNRPLEDKSMFEAVKVKAAKKSLIDLLTFVVATTGTHGFAYAPEADLLKLHKAEPTFIVIDSTMKDQSGNVKVTATQVAIDALTAANSTPAPVAVVKAEPMNFEIQMLDEVPATRKGGNKSDSYPFDKLVAPVTNAAGKTQYASFFVPATEAKPNPSKFLSSTVSSANKRHAKTDKAEYTVRSHVGADGKVDGAHVIRLK